MSNWAKAKAKTTLLYIKKYAILTKGHVNLDLRTWKFVYI